jgi:hypothetical protein
MATTILDVGTRWTCVCQLYALATVLLGKTDPDIYQREGWVNTGVHADALERVEISGLCQESNHDF